MSTAHVDNHGELTRKASSVVAILERCLHGEDPSTFNSGTVSALTLASAWGYPSTKAMNDNLTALRPLGHLPVTAEIATEGPAMTTTKSGPRHVDGTGTRRRLQALNALGWSRNELAHMLDVSAPSINARLRKTGPVHRDTAAKVRALYGDLWDTTPPPMTGKAAGVRNCIRRDAAERGWVVPLLWDDESIDDPTAAPYVDEVTQHRTTKATGIVNADSLTDCAHWGMTITQAADRLRVQHDTITAGLDRLDDQDHAHELREQYHRNAIAQGHDRTTRDGLGLRRTA